MEGAVLPLTMLARAAAVQLNQVFFSYRAVPIQWEAVSVLWDCQQLK